MREQHIFTEEDDLLLVNRHGVCLRYLLGKKDQFRGKTDNHLPVRVFETVASNLEVLFPDNDASLFAELQERCLKAGKPWEGALISAKVTCRVCKGRLQLATNRASEVVMYNGAYGTFFGMKYPRICSQKCNFVQHYGAFYTLDGKKYYDDDWERNEFLLSSSSKMLQDFDGELLIGILSYEQKADIYN
ncbi:Hypp5386 [Branchiostoma lanceolatum]|uniref:Hypp5386 protein n=1 Tax=Branchiostoma lanceolatum TaxID=7740 RepID=A0A8K0AFV9_BRALA|nr:Hypp5386 [Branchiostoma lanceolatum]